MKKPNLWGLIKKSVSSLQEVNHESTLEEEQLFGQNTLLSLIENTSDYLIIKDGHGRWLRANDRVLSFFGLENVNYTGKTVIDLAKLSGVLRNCAQIMVDLDQQAWDTRKKIKAEVQIPSADGDSMFFDVIKIPSYYPDQTRKELITIAVNVSEQKKMQEALIKSENSLSHAQRIAQLGHYELDIEKNELQMSDVLCQILGIETSVISFMDYMNNYIVPEDSEKVGALLTQVLHGSKNSYFIEYRIVRPDGKIRFMTASGDAIRDQSGKPIRLIGISQDITEKIEVENKLQESEIKYRSIVEESLVGVYIVQHWKLVYVNPFIVEMTGYTQEELLHLHLMTLISPEHKQLLMDQMNAVLNGIEDNSADIFRFIRKDGTPIETEIRSKLISLDGKPTVIGTIRDVTEKVKTEERLHFMAFHDALTELPNRRFFEKKLHEELEECMRNNWQLALMYLDLDRFKFINDSLGHSYGDRLLKLVAERLCSCIDNEKATVVRMGGDEFAVILPNIKSHDSPLNSARLIIDELEKPFYIDKYELYITTSIGVSYYPFDGANPETLTKNADIALYRAKERGKNNYQIYTASMNIATYKTFLLEKDLRKALSGDEFELYFQPRVCTKSGAIVGAEALIRWHHPEWGLVSPAEFIPVAEETGLIISIGDWVLRTVSEHIVKWNQAGLPTIPISVNVSSLRFMQKDFLDFVLQILEDTNIKENWLEIEITESALMQKEDVVQNTISKLREFGVKIALDDFGTGYSSLSYLTHFDIDILKIDRSFIRELPDNPQKTSVTKAIIQMAKGLNMKIVAEGVEKNSQLSFLKQQDCDQIQGYLFSPPAPVDAFLKLLSKRRLRPGTSDIERGNTFENRRHYYRINLYFPLSSEMTIVKIKDKNIDLGTTETLIEDIGLGGLRFLSNIKLPVNPEIILEFETEILGQIIRFSGHVVWKNEIEENVYQYGLEYKMHEKERDLLAPLLNDFSVQIRKTPLVPRCRFVKMDRISYIKKLN